MKTGVHIVDSRITSTKSIREEINECWSVAASAAREIYFPNVCANWFKVQVQSKIMITYQKTNIQKEMNCNCVRLRMLLTALAEHG